MNPELQKSLQMSMSPSTVDGYMLMVLLIMVAAGLLGGAANYYLSDQTENDNSGQWGKYLTLGLFSALTVPLFLNMISSNLMDAGRTRPINFFVFSGFCLVYVLVTRRFFENIANRLLGRSTENENSEGKKTETEKTELFEVLQPVAEIFVTTENEESKETTPESVDAPLPGDEPGSLPISLSPSARQEVSFDTLSRNDLSIVHALAKDFFICGNLSPLTEKTGLPRDFVSARLTVLKNSGIIETRINDKNILHWHVSPQNKKALDEILSSQKEE